MDLTLLRRAMRRSCVSQIQIAILWMRILKLFPREGSRIHLEPPPPAEGEGTGEVSTKNCQKRAVGTNESLRGREVDDLL